MTLFEGAAVALVTPFTEDGVNYEELKRLIDFQLAGHTDAFVINGTTGEPATMTMEERHKAAITAIEHIAGKVPVIVGTGSNNTAAAVEETRYAESIGADAVLVVTPYYNKCSQEGLYRHYEAVASATNLPLVLYNVPSRTGVNILPETLNRLADIDNIVAIKEASGNISQIAEMARLVKGRMDIYSGNDDQIVPILSVGGKGVISVLSNVLPDKTHEMVVEYLSGNTQKAADMQLYYKPLIDALFCDVNPIPAKTALNMMGYNAGPLRLPLCSMSESKQTFLKNILTEYGLA